LISREETSESSYHQVEACMVFQYALFFFLKSKIKTSWLFAFYRRFQRNRWRKCKWKRTFSFVFKHIVLIWFHIFLSFNCTKTFV